MKILVPVDGSAFTRRMLAYLAAHDEWLGAQHRYVVLNVSPPLPRRAAAAIGRDTVAAYHDDEVERVFKPIRTFLRKQGLEAEFIAKVGHPAEVIVETARRTKADLVMMGSHGHGILGSLLLGSVTSKVLATSDVPVLIVR